MAKCKALREEGVSAFHWAGGYRLPVPTVIGDIQKDVRCPLLTEGMRHLLFASSLLQPVTTGLSAARGCRSTRSVASRGASSWVSRPAPFAFCCLCSIALA